ncbi:zinc finger protein 385D isoform X2 [Kryptolebias marmoratus]|uniref:zinc finger protein 385D isoform X2 n=1 Tax=Kryptolebias marmoratus TaxID=37003 RepID=UPI0018ACD2DC|nr:zinc finger protein 385D isoform X2 [Kryptolebias marmoratus]
MESSMFFGNTCQNGLLPALVRPTLPAVQTSMSMKQFLPIPLDTASAVSLFPGFSTSQALAHYKGTKHAKKLKSLETPKSKLKGSAVTKETANQEVAKGVNTSHIPSGTDRKDVSSGEAPPSAVPSLKPSLTAAAPPSGPLCSPKVTAASDTDLRDERSKVSSPSETDPEQEAVPEAETDAETEDEKARRLLYCSLCKVAVNSASQLEAHNSGTKHKTMLEARSGVGSIKSFPRPGVKSKLASTSKSSTGLQNKTFYCETCDVHVNSETQLKQHISSRRHKDRAAGKPAKPKYSPYSKPQKGPPKQPIKLILGKERPCQPLTAQILPAHLAAVAAATIGNSFTHRSNNAPNPALTPGLFQTQSLPAALLRPAPGPVRTSHPPVLFAPY